MTDTTITFIEPLKQDPPSYDGIAGASSVGDDRIFFHPIKENEGIAGASSGGDDRIFLNGIKENVKTPVSIGSKKKQNGNLDNTHSANSLLVKLVLYYHLSNDKNWNFESYKLIQSVATIEEAVSLNENLSDNIIKYCMLFMMKSGIPPIWEDPRNINGGCFSYKVYNKYVVEVWKKMVYAFCGGTLMINKENMKHVNGITISPKKNFCILKIWFENLKTQNAEEVVDIDNLSRTGVIFRAFYCLNH
jgi:hypothetical protein